MRNTKTCPCPYIITIDEIIPATLLAQARCPVGVETDQYLTTSGARLNLAPTSPQVVGQYVVYHRLQSLWTGRMQIGVLGHLRRGIRIMNGSEPKSCHALTCHRSRQNCSTASRHPCPIQTNLQYFDNPLPVDLCM